MLGCCSVDCSTILFDRLGILRFQRDRERERILPHRIIKYLEITLIYKIGTRFYSSKRERERDVEDICVESPASLRGRSVGYDTASVALRSTFNGDSDARTISKCC